MRRMRVVFKLIFVAILAGIAPNIIGRVVSYRFSKDWLDSRFDGLGLRRTACREPTDCGNQQYEKKQRFDDSVWTQLRPSLLCD